MSIRYLRTLAAIAERGSFASAARALNLTQSAVSMQMKALEDDLGAALFDRTRRPPLLTEQGKALVPKAEAAIIAYDRLRHDAASEADDVEGHLSLGAVPSVLTGIIPKALVALRARHPRLHVELSNGLSADLIERLMKGNLDVAILSELGTTPDNLTWTPFLREPLMLIAPIDAPDIGAEQLLASYPFIRYTRTAWVGQLIDRILKRRHIAVRETMTLDTLEAVTTMVHHGLGVSIVPQQVIPSPLQLPVRRLALAKPVVHRVLGLAHRTRHDKEALTSALLAELRQLAASARNGEPAAARTTGSAGTVAKTWKSGKAGAAAAAKRRKTK